MKPDLKGLAKLADHLEQVPRKQFNMYTWWTKTSCGTKGCILGHAAHLFPSRFKVSNVVEWGTTITNIVHKQSGAIGHRAFANGFRIDEFLADVLTSPHSNVHTPKQAARAVRKMVERLTQEMGRK